MSQPHPRTALVMRPYEETDEPQVLALLSAALGGGPAGTRTREFFRWKHFEDPFGASYLLVAETEGRIVGLRAFMRWSFRSGGRTIRAVRAVDTATHPHYQGRGIFSRLTAEAIEGIRGETDMIFNTPNEKSLPGYLKMGWVAVGTFRVSIRPRKPWRLARNPRPEVPGPNEVTQRGPSVGAEPALEALSDPQLDPLLDEAVPGSSDIRLHTPKDGAYLRWRYGLAPLLDYRAIRERSGDVLTGVALFRVRPRGKLWESTVSDLIVRPGDDRTARRLLARVVRASRVDHLTCHFPNGSAAARAARRAGFLRTRRGMTFVVNQIHPVRQGPDPSQMGAWALSLGDLEVF